MAKAGDAVQVSMFDTLPDMAPPQPKLALEEPADLEPLLPKAKSAAKSGAKAKSRPATALANDEAFTLENFLPYRILEVAQGLSRRMSKMLLEEWDMSLAEWQVLASLSREGAVSVREVEPKTLLDTVAVSRAAKRLTDRKLIKREVNKRDKRLVVLKPTKKGRDVASEIGHLVMEMESDLLKGMNVQDRIRLSQLLKTLA
ncbi:MULTISPECIES: MarR family winged helix-turn-helix transcriptional regulator [Cohaesibacter]|uniref:MarR family winged helix-turn-helix transcriptional regulator n=1 Tax=Cohaesibacter TaxID=655352 RepID=UPI000DE9CAC8|nr:MULTISPECIES: MarR family winged helix-turn-helix transcriptional regulator [Cohaesibacter]TLP48870.1 winged helix-turn-helix transcriptional regulator [Cohaesibacter sp. CAU 1516]